MKTIEQKAKAYDKIIDRAKKELNACGSQDCDAARQIFRLFPELKESEGDKIKKSIIAIINNYVDNSNTFKPKMIAWLEKAGMSAKYHDICDTCVRQPTCQSDCFLKQSEQNPWSEDDENNTNSIVSRLEVDISYWESRSKTRTNEDKKLIEWLKSIKNRVGCEVNCTTTKEWSEKDLNFLDDTEYILQVVKTETSRDNEYQRAKKCIDWLKSLKDKCTWKPSQSMINSLSTAVKYGQTDDLEALSELLKQLKEL